MDSQILTICADNLTRRTARSRPRHSPMNMLAVRAISLWVQPISSKSLRQTQSLNATRVYWQRLLTPCNFVSLVDDGRQLTLNLTFNLPRVGFNKLQRCTLG